MPISPNKVAKKIFKINGNESSIAYISEESRFRIRPVGVFRKKFKLAFFRIKTLKFNEYFNLKKINCYFAQIFYQTFVNVFTG